MNHGQSIRIRSDLCLANFVGIKRGFCEFGYHNLDRLSMHFSRKGRKGHMNVTGWDVARNVE